MALKKSKSIIALAISSLLLLAACDDDGSSSPVTPSDSVESSSSIDSTNSSSSDINVVEESSSSTDSSSSFSSDSEESSSSTGKVFESSFNPNITYGTMTDSRDKKVYKTIKIGDQVWMAENLNYADSSKTPSLLKRSWCYNNVAANCDVVGRLYTWAAAIDSVKLATDADNPQDCGYGKTCTLPAKVQGICPDGWHLPDTTEWRTLINTVGGANVAGKKLKATIGWKAYCGIITNEDAYGFSALPAGGRSYDGNFDSDGYSADFWSTTEGNSYGAYCMDLDYNGDNASLYGYTRNYGYSVRCLQN